MASMAPSLDCYKVGAAPKQHVVFCACHLDLGLDWELAA